MNLNRRTYLLGCTVGLSSVAGCTGDSDLPAVSVPEEFDGVSNPISPDLRISETRQSGGRLVELSASGNRYTAEIENEGMSGTLLVELYFRAEGTTSSEPAASKELQLDAGERETVTLAADQPPWAEEYGVKIRGTRFVANVRNTGSEAAVRVWLAALPDETTIAEKTIGIGAAETKRVGFHTTHEFENDYEIRAILADA